MEKQGYKPQRCNCGKMFCLQTAFPFPIPGLCCPKCTYGAEDQFLRTGQSEIQLRGLLEQEAGTETKDKRMLALGMLLLEGYTEPVMNGNRLVKTEEANRLLQQVVAMGMLSEDEKMWMKNERSNL